MTRCKRCKLDWESDKTLSMPLHQGSGVSIAHCPKCFLECTRIVEGEEPQTIGEDKDLSLPPMEFLLTGLPSVINHIKKYIAHRRTLLTEENPIMKAEDLDYLENLSKEIETIRNWQ